METAPHTSENQVQASPGEILKRCREFHDMSLDDAAEATKISAEYLQALEENRLTQFASLAYLKGFVRIYAHSLGLNPDDIIRLYEKMYTVSNQNEKPTRASLPVKKKGTFRFPFQKLFIPLTLLFLILVTSAVINRSGSQHNQNPQTVHAPATPVPLQNPISSSRTTTPVSEKRPQSSEEKQPAENVLSQKSIAPPPQEHSGFIVSLKILRNCSLTVTVDSSAAQQHEMTAGDRIEWQGNEQIQLELPDAGAVEGAINGKILPVFGTDGIRKNITLTKDGIK